MGDEGEDPQGNNLADERTAILQLQSEIARKGEQLERLKQKATALQNELETRSSELESKQGEFQKEARKAAKGKESAGARTTEAENDYMKKQVSMLLQERIPAIRAAAQDQGEDGDAGFGDVQDITPEETTKAALHTSVLVSYVVMVDGRADDYKVSYRIDKDTTVEQLHRDACEYWGCSHKDYVLCKLGKNDTPEDLSKKKDEQLQKEDILDPAEQSHLHLVKATELKSFEEKLKREQAQKTKEQAKQKDDEEEVTLKTLKHGLGNVVAEPIAEPFVEALKPWPGVHHLLKSRRRHRDNAKWKLASLSDMLMYSMLTALSIACLALRNDLQVMEIKSGIALTLGDGLKAEVPPGQMLMSFSDITLYDDIWTWFGGTFASQLFNTNSTLLQTYVPVGFLRLRQQRAKPRPCPRPNIPADLQQSCYFIEVDSTTQDKSQIQIDPANIGIVANATVPLPTPSPLQWYPTSVASADLLGYMQYSYDGSGYMMAFPLANLSLLGRAIPNMIPSIRDNWITTATRMFVVELTLANYNLGGFVSTSFMVEISPSGAIQTSMKLFPFTVSSTVDGWTKALDILRWIIVIGYLVLIKVYMSTSHQVAQGKGGLSYVFSFNGFLDEAVIAIFVATQYIWLKPSPPAPHLVTSYQSYSYYAYQRELNLMGEGILALLLLTRVGFFFRMVPQVYRFSKIFGRSLKMFGFFCFLILPVFLGIIVLANAIWSSYVMEFSTWTVTFVNLLLAIQVSFDVDVLYSKNREWTIPFILYFFLAMVTFFMNVFLAITVHAYFEVDLLEGSKPKDNRWSKDQWMDWALWAPVYQRVTGRTPGSSRKVGGEESDEEAQSDEEEDED